MFQIRCIRNKLGSWIRIRNSKLWIRGYGSLKKYKDPYYFIQDSKKFQKKGSIFINFTDLPPPVSDNLFFFQWPPKCPGRTRIRIQDYGSTEPRIHPYEIMKGSGTMKLIPSCLVGKVGAGTEARGIPTCTWCRGGILQST
jgi:hypothetical protein